MFRICSLANSLVFAIAINCKSTLTRYNTTQNLQIPAYYCP